MDIRVIEKEKLFTPTWHNNKDQPVGKQIRVLFKSFPAAADLPTYKKEYWKGGKLVQEYNDVGLLMTHIEKIENLTYQGEKIIKPQDLMLSGWMGFYPLIEEIRDYALKIEQEITEGESEASE